MKRGSDEATTPAPWTGVRWWRIDVALALVVAAGQVGGTLAVTRHQTGTVTPFAIALLALGAAMLVIRSRRPVAVLGVAFATTLWYWSAPYPRGPIFVSLIVAFGSCLITGHRLAAWVALVAGYVAFAWLPPALGTHAGPSLLVALAVGAWLAVLASVFEGLRLTRLRVVAVGRSRAEEDRRRASEERLRVAHDLHDALAHHISLISVQATTGAHLFDRHPAEARAALANIRVVARQALGELRSALDLLRPSDESNPDEPNPPAPAPRLEQLEDLVTQAGAAGLAVDLERLGAIRAVPDSVATVGYRIVQEALTNALRHSGASSAIVRVSYGNRDLTVEIDDPGPDRTPGVLGSVGAGRGLAGMRERVESVGGQLLVGPRPDGGFRVKAELPTESAER